MTSYKIFFKSIFGLMILLFLSSSVFSAPNVTITAPTAGQLFTFNTDNTLLTATTNESASCTYIYDAVETNFSTTGNVTHSTLFDLGADNFGSAQSAYLVQVNCTGVIENVTFYKDYAKSLERTTTQLPSVGSDVGSFLTNIAPGVVNFIFVLAIISGIVGLFGAVILIIKNSMKRK